MSQLRRNVVANFIGKGCTVIAQLAFVPLYLKLMGLDASGLVGFGVTLNAAVQLMDMGLSTTLNREMARLSTEPECAQEVKNLVRTLEIVYWPISLLIASGVAAAAPLVAHHWFVSEQLSPATVQRAIMMMGCSIALQWPYSLYEGGLLGLQKQVLVNAISTATAILRTLGALVVLLVVGKTVEVYFAWQIVISAGMTVAVTVALWQSLPRSRARPLFDPNLLKGIRNFAAGVMGASVAAFLVSQCDRIVLSRQVRLDIFGCYTTAAQIAGILLYAAGPFFTALFPRFVQLIAVNDGPGLKTLYHRSCQLVSVIVIPIAVMLALYASDLTRILETWTGKPLHIAHTDKILALLVIGFAANALVNLPYALQLASGWTKLAIYQNAVTICIQVPLTFWFIARWGATGAAFVWMLVNTAYVFIMVPIMHRRLLRGEMVQWYTQDIGGVFVAALLIAGLARLWIPATENVTVTLARILGIGTVTALGCVAASPLAMEVVRRRLRGRIMGQVQ